MKMHTGAVLFSLASFSAFVAAENTVENDDVPQQCVQACQDTINLSRTCDQQTEGDTAYRQCFCNNTSAQSQINSCASCVKTNRPTDNDNDVSDLMSDCGWSYATVQASGASGSVSSTGVLSIQTSTGVSRTSFPTSIPTDLRTTLTNTAATQTSTGTATSGNTVVTTSPSQAAGAMPTAGAGAMLLGLGLGAAALL